MGRMIAKKVRGMGWMAKTSLVLIFTLIVSTFMCGGLSTPKKAEAAVTYQSAGTIAYSAASGTTVAPGYPTPLASGDLLVLIIGMKPGTANGGSVTTPTGWIPITALTGAGGYGTTLGADTGNTNLFAYYHISDGTETGTLTVTLAQNNVSWAQIYRASNATGNWSVAGATGSDATAGNVSILFGSDPAVTANDFILGAMSIPTDVTTPAQFSAEAFTQTGVTFSAVTEIGEPDSTTGNQIGGFVVRAGVTAGTSTAAPTMAATAGGTTTNVRGPAVFIRIREAAFQPPPPPTPGLPSTITSCAGCHQYSPTFADGTARDVPPGQFPGSHQPHVQRSGYACSACHVAPATETAVDFEHRDGIIQMVAAAGTYTKGLSFAQSNAAFVGGTCSTATCHANVYGTGSVTTPAWGTAAGCSACHTGATGTIAATGPNTGSHAAHTTAICTDCHNAGTTATTVPSTGHADGNIDVTSGYPANVTKHAAGTYTGTCSTAACHANVYGTGSVTTPVWGTASGCTACHSVAIAASGPNTGSHALHNVTDCSQCHQGATNSTTVPTANHADGNIDVTGGYPANVTKHAAGTYTGTCSTATCHANVYGTGTVTTPVWGPTVTTGCTGCHSGAGAIQAYGPNTGSHALHNVTDCSVCHQGATNSTTVPTLNHGDGNIDVTGGYPANVVKHTAGTYTGTCSTATCHANVYGTGTGTTPVWGTTGAGCSSCHSGTGVIQAYGPNTGSHAKHNDPVCADCHNAGTTATTVPSTGHADGNIDVTGGYPLNVVKHTAGTYTGTCSTASCHANVYGTGTVTTPVWGVAAGCSACHSGTGVIQAYGPNTGSHSRHNDPVCTDCHNAGTTATTVPSTGHADGNIDVTGGYPLNVAKHAAPALGTSYGATFTCSTTTCHANVYGTGSAVTPAWGTTGSGCSSCHSVAIAATGPNTGSHALHNMTDCSQCHAGTTNSTTVPTANHADGNIDVTGGYPLDVAKHAAPAVGTSYGATFTCTTTLCHGAGSPAWGANTATLSCQKCHGAATNNTSTSPFKSTTGATANTDAKAGTHTAHLGAANAPSGTPTGHATSSNVACTECHTVPATSTTAGHIDTALPAELTFGTLARTGGLVPAYNATTRQCSNVYCHGSTLSAATSANRTPTWNVPLLTGVATNDCGKCHGYPPTSATHTGVTPTQCASCHSHINAAGTGFTNVALHINGTVEGGDCVSCHNVAQPINAGPLAGQSQTRRAVSLEFASTWSHKRAAAGAVTKQDCIVCHMEGDMASGNPTALHKNGTIELRDPDTGLTIKGVTFGGTGAGAYTSTTVDAAPARFSRNLNSSTIEPDTAAIMVNHCLKCHDTDGALSTTARVPTTGTALRPFGTAVASTGTYYLNNVAAGNTAGSVVDVKSSFATTNASYHPILGKQNNWYLKATGMMKAPWTYTTRGATVDTASYGLLMTCWDCHAPAGVATATTLTSTVTAHGGPATIRRDSWAAANGATTLNLCTECHKDAYSTGTSNHATGSGFGSGGSSNIGSNFRTCSLCHSSGNNSRPWRGVDAHGFNQMAQLRTDTTTAANAVRWAGARGGSRPYAFIRTTRLGSWRPAAATGDTLTGTVGCSQYSSGGTGCSNGHGTYTPGGTY